jgi:hypothetical protein
MTCEWPQNTLNDRARWLRGNNSGRTGQKTTAAILDIFGTMTVRTNAQSSIFIRFLHLRALWKAENQTSSNTAEQQV